MMEKRPLCPERVRKISGSFAFIEHRFLREGFWATLSPKELVLYVFFILVADRNGLSYYSFDKICSLLEFSLDDYLMARNALIQKDLIAFDGPLFQVLSLPDHPVHSPRQALQSAPQMQHADPGTIRQLIRDSLGADYD
jgi:hypothetical protein